MHVSNANFRRILDDVIMMSLDMSLVLDGQSNVTKSAALLKVFNHRLQTSL